MEGFLHNILRWLVVVITAVEVVVTVVMMPVPEGKKHCAQRVNARN